MISLKNCFCLATLAFLSAHASFLQGAGNEAAFLQDIERQSPQLAAPQSPLRLEPAVSIDLEDARSQTNHEPSAARSALAMAVYPLDLLKKASFCVMKAPLFFVAATSALLPQAHAAGRHPTVYEPVYRGAQTGLNATQYPPPLVREPQYYKTDFGLTDAWDTRTCKGRALNGSHKKTFEDKKSFCRDLITCMPRIVACNDPRTGRNRNADRPMFCTQSACDSGFRHNTFSQEKQQAIDDCAQRLCQTEGAPYTGNFLCKAPKKDTHNSPKRQQIDQAIFAAEQCFEPFCQAFSHETCPQESSFFGGSPCNDTLCSGRFVPDDIKEVSPGVFKSLEQIGEETLEQCKQVPLHRQNCD
ncbi:MAG: hypothetical protein ACPG7U_05280 [Holosporaceae bacterium]